MSRPELIIPYDPKFLGDDFVVPIPTLSDALHAVAFADGAVLDYPVLTDLPPRLTSAIPAAGPAQIPAAFWKVIVLRDSEAGAEDLSVVAFAMRQSEMWNDRDGRPLSSRRLQGLRVSRGGGGGRSAAKSYAGMRQAGTSMPPAAAVAAT
ncbi:MAG TPA: hypothetical protein VGP39_18400 [Bradyrhizobium sp.]|jgi:hypothetical protein|nr:hypothetical protein [Bradyrhizobium sp.]